MISWARDVGRKNGFIIVINVSNATRIGVKARVLLTCERSGQYKHEEDHKRQKIKQTGSKKCGCPFALKGQKVRRK